ncbi:hypothetical protein L810_3625 [Burkholderia sp. AU4i]|nr:hypothetical protein L810_3625 [Burkholderia sp. AU4i]QOH34719.1 hypothetical protein C7S14_3859 [Burkholderia cepacia]
MTAHARQGHQIGLEAGAAGGIGQAEGEDDRRGVAGHVKMGQEKNGKATDMRTARRNGRFRPCVARQAALFSHYAAESGPHDGFFSAAQRSRLTPARLLGSPAPTRYHHGSRIYRLSRRGLRWNTRAGCA